MKPGLVSISFRDLSQGDICALAARAGLEGIEWGGDVHVPHGDLAAARRAADLTRASGLAVAAYGSYYRAGESEAEGLPFDSVLASALELAAPTIRVWAGKKGSAQADAAYREQVAADLRRIGAVAERAGVAVACEYHGGTLTDADGSAQALLRDVAHPNILLYWQPSTTQSEEASLAGLKAIRSRLSNLHVYWWRGHDRLPLAEGKESWARYFAAASGDDRPRWAMLEFVRGDSQDQCVEDAHALREMLASQTQ